MGRFGVSNHFCFVFKIIGVCPRLKSLREPCAKMSKSDSDMRSRIEIVEQAEQTELKLRKAVTDFESRITFEPERRPGVSNLVSQIYNAENKMVKKNKFFIFNYLKKKIFFLILMS